MSIVLSLILVYYFNNDNKDNYKNSI